jgi:hypothetical protein
MRSVILVKLKLYFAVAAISVCAAFDAGDAKILVLMM